MTHNEVAAIIVEVAIGIHKQLGPGLLESAYAAILAHELRKRGLRVECEVAVPIRWDGMILGTPLRIDLLVENIVVVEVKSVEHTLPVHKKQVLTYLRLAEKRLGLLLNFGTAYMRDGLCRIANGMVDGEPDDSDE